MNSPVVEFKAASKFEVPPLKIFETALLPLKVSAYADPSTFSISIKVSFPWEELTFCAALLDKSTVTPSLEDE